MLGGVPVKIVISKGAKGWVRTIICALIVVVVLLNVIGYIFDLKYISAFAAVEEVNKYEVRSQLLIEAMNQVGVCSPEETTEVWANGLKMRSAALQYSVMNKELKDKYSEQLEENAPNWVTGISSPWVQSYKAQRLENFDKNIILIKLTFFLETSVGPAGDYKAILALSYDGDFCRITKIYTDEELYPYTLFNSEG